MSAPCAAIGVDLGSSRVGLAGADPTGTIATPLVTLERRHPKFWSALERACAERGCRLLVIGLPRRLDGSEGEAAAGARRFAAEAERRLGLEVAMWDEWLTTVQAERALIEGGVRRAQRRSTVDAVAASLILQSYLDARPRRSSP
ncbi:MAG: Holliday junction resolvase RuvX [Candidatus Dormibacteria bacterium]